MINAPWNDVSHSFEEELELDLGDLGPQTVCTFGRVTYNGSGELRDVTISKVTLFGVSILSKLSSFTITDLEEALLEKKR